MAKYIVTRIYKRTETLEVVADNESEAYRLARLLEDEFVVNNDDMLYDQEVKELE